ncbi:MAG: SseB family protein [Candidatus Dormibacteraeota bacterium]|nr:SseB family protein [Candidatus Dormibacteraeota bacterium]
MTNSRRSEIPDEPQNDLETALLAAAEDPGARSGFYRALMSSDLFVVGRLETVEGRGKEGKVSADPGDKLVIWPRGDDARVHAFSSLARLQAAIGNAKVPYVGLPTDVLFAAIDPEVEIVLNEGVWYGKQIVPEERRLLVEHVAEEPKPL